MVLRNATALEVEDSKVALRACMTLRGCQPKQPRCLDKILRDAGAEPVAAAKVVLRAG
jgi:hypothetical protein